MAAAPDPGDWSAVGHALRRRVFDELRLTKAELSQSSGISYKTLTRYLDGEPIVRRDKERALCEAVRWTPDSVERILAGGEPIPIEAEPRPSQEDVEARLTDITRRLEEALAEVEELRLGRQRNDTAGQGT